MGAYLMKLSFLLFGQGSGIILLASLIGAISLIFMDFITGYR